MANVKPRVTRGGPQVRASEGFEPAMGRPDPEAVAAEVAPEAITHYPSREGPVCGLRPSPTNANAYNVDDPTCPRCADYLDKTRAHTQRLLETAAGNAHPSASRVVGPGLQPRTLPPGGGAAK